MADLHSIFSATRKSGIPLIGDLTWGSHFCQFYQTDQDVFDILVPFFRAGLDGNELCVWEPPASIGGEKARMALRSAISNFDRYWGNHQIAILPPERRHAPGQADGEAVLTLLDSAIASGFDGLRIATCPGAGKTARKGDACEGIHTVGRYHILAAYLYPRDEFDAVGFMAAVQNHSFALVRATDRWEVIRSSEARIAKDALKRSQEKLHFLFTNMSEGFAYHRIVQDAAGVPIDYVFLEVNEAFERLTGLKGSHIIGKRATEVLPGLERDATDWIGLYGKVALSGRPVKFDSYSGPLKRWYAVSAFSPHKGYFAITFSDITERKTAEEALKTAHRELQEHATRLEEANRELESFGYSVSHDLRAPLRAIDGFTEIILAQKGEEFDPETLRKFRIIQNNALKMGQLIDDLLRLSRLGRTGLNLLRLDMNRMLEESLQEIRSAVPDREFAVHITPLPEAEADPTLIRQLFGNLLSNAVKFTRQTPDPRIEVGSFEESGRTVYFVRDNGIGFDMKYYDKLFGVFQRLVGESQFEGTGVGLAIVRRIAQRHGGKVWAEGETGRGATFYFTLAPEP
jgi:PAS domain S-box-containing protein